MSYPHHETPELSPMLKLCCDLLYERNHYGYFYDNDKKALADITVRELSNIPINTDTTELRFRYTLTLVIIPLF